MKKKICDNISYIILLLLFLFLLLIFVIEYITKEKEQYEAYNDFTRGDIVMTLSYNKDPLLYFHCIRYVQLFTDDEKISKGDLIFDFAAFEFIPILNYLNENSEDKELIESFSGIMKFLEDYNSATIGLAENVLVKQSNGKYYIYKNDKYTYETQKEVIDKKSFNKIYNEYLETINCKSVEEHFIKELSKNKNINSKYNYNEIVKNISYNYSKFYKDNEPTIISIISNDLEKFVKFLYTDYIFIDEENNDMRYLLKDIDTETLEISFNFTEGDRIYHAASKYYTHSYILDIYDIWEQLKEKGYPLLYS